MPEEMINLFEELGVPVERAREIYAEIMEMLNEKDYLSDVLHAIPESYCRDGIVLGVFLAEMIIDNNSWLPKDVFRDTTVEVDPAQN